MKKILPFIVSALLAILVWLASPAITGYGEPWDAGGFYYVLALVVTGFLTGILFTAPLWVYYLGALTGQLIYMLLTAGENALILAGVLFLAGYTVLFLAGTALGRWARQKINKKAGG